jgi:hypothetical protein
MWHLLPRGDITRRVAQPATPAEHRIPDTLTYDAMFIRDYAWAFSQAGSKIPIDLTAHYSIAREFNGNTTLCHRVTGEVLLFAPDHAFEFVTPLEGCPDFTLYRIEGARDIRGWVDCVSRQWKKYLDSLST